jgi:group I intron endonuclease
MEYVGQTWYTVEQRFFAHKKNNDTCIDRAINEYGIENFKVEKLLIVKNQKMADKWEDYYILARNTLNPEIGYNKRRGCSHGLHTEETKIVLSKFFTEYWKINQHPSTGLSPSEETRQKMSLVKLGTKASQETKDRMSMARLSKPDPCSNLIHYKPGEDHLHAVLTFDQADQIRVERANGVKIQVLADIYKVNRATILRVIKNRTYVRPGDDLKPVEIASNILNIDSAKEIREAFSRNVSIEELSSKFGVSNHTIRRVVTNRIWIEAGTKPTILQLRSKLYKLDYDTASDIRNEYRTSNISVKALAKKYGVSGSSITDIIDAKTWIREGEKVEPIPHRQSQAKLTQEIADKIRTEYDPNNGIYESTLAKKYGVTRSCIQAIRLNKHWTRKPSP